MLRLVASLLACATIVLLANDAHAALPPANSGTIGFAADSASPAYGAVIELEGTWPGHLNNPRAYVACYQDGVLVYGEATGDSGYGNFKQDGFYFTLGGGYSQWVANGGGEADCTATLYYFAKGNGNSEWNGNGPQVYVELAQTGFHADA